MPRPPPPPSWMPNLESKKGFWADARWYDLQLERKMPLVEPMLRQLIFALPPLPAGCRVCDLLGGSGRVAMPVMEAYPGIYITLIDDDPVRVDIATAKMTSVWGPDCTFDAKLATVGPHDTLPGGPYDVILAVMALQFIVRPDGPSPPETVTQRLRALLENLRESLVPGGHLLVGDNAGALPLYRQMRCLEDVGFVDVDCAWRQDDMFVYGGRRAP